ncbi:MAG: DNA/RNA helicase domain-containing protein [Patescibacteria group bacterium]
MSEIVKFPFSSSGVEKIRNYKYGSDWPVVYLIENGKELYVGETIRAYARTKQHLENGARKQLKTIHVISDDEFNKSATLDTESSLIEYLVADGKYILQNGNGGLQNHDYFDRERYRGKFELLWKKLQELKIARNDLLQIRNSDLFKYSPYKTLTDDQYLIASKLLEYFRGDKRQSYIIHGGPGTGKTILATYLVKQLVQEGRKDIALVIAMVSLRKTLKKVFRSIPGLSPNMVIGPNEVANQKYDILIVDETHRLHQRRNIPNYGTFDTTNKSFGLGNEGTELDWILKSASHVVLFYDERQSVRPSDISMRKVLESNPISFELKTQMRVRGGREYLDFIDHLMESKVSTRADFSEYDFKVYSDLGQMVIDIKKQEKIHTLSRLVAGYAWKWVSRNDVKVPDIVIGDIKLFWNSKIHDWVNSPNAINEVGCIHTIQGYDLNYAGVIIGPEMSYDPISKKIVVDKTKYLDSNGHRGVDDPEELKRYVINIYKTLLTRGILGTYVYITDDNLRDYFKEHVSLSAGEGVLKDNNTSIESPYVSGFINVPLFDSVGCGELMFADSTVQEMIPVKSELMSKGSKYFVLRTSGDSMNQVGINDGDLVLCRKNYHPEEGNNVVALIGDDATIKEYRREGGVVVLKPRSSNSKHKPLKFTSNEEVGVQGVVVCVIKE